MCKFNYTGFGCGHIDPQGTPVTHELCGPPARKPHEPMCDPPDSYGLSPNGIPYCPDCKLIIDRLQAAWTATRNEWRANKALPEVQINRVNRDIIASRAKIGNQAVRQGPHHTESRRYEPEQEDIIDAAEKLAESFKKLDKAWEDNLSVLRDFNTIPQSSLNGFNRRREIAKNSIKTADSELLERIEEGLLDDMYEIHNKKLGLLG
ncbi:hypothetical protein F5X96DRAFT_684859 [Biscogniauxia mediterranea]|nr:hypothetical protein F5X96DRAFT_684859 [Biscogniauxia mediterranea]